MPAAPRESPRAPWFDGRGFRRDSVISLGVGLLIALFISVAMPPAWRLRTLAYGAMIGLSINFFCHVLDRLYRRRLPAGQEASRIVLAALYFVGGSVGWMLATLLAVRMNLVPARYFEKLLPYFIPSAGALAIIIGLLFYTFARMRERLEENVGRLKEAEFAQKELELARSIQRRLLPPGEMEGEGWRLAARNDAARWVAGDFYDVFRLSDGALGVVVADVAGKGVGASLIMASVKAVLPMIASDRSVEQTLAELNRRLVLELAAREFVALLYLRYEPDGRFRLGNAGLPDPYRVPVGGRPEALSVPGSRLPLGVRNDVAYRAVEGRLEPGEKLVLLTDGLPEAMTAGGDPIGYPALESLMLTGDSATPSEYVDGLFGRLRDATVAAIEDDWTTLVLERPLQPVQPGSTLNR